MAEVSVALLFGIVVATVAGPRLRPLTPGLAFASQRVLRLGIVLLGARLSLGEIARIGVPSTVLIVLTMAASFAIVLVVARLVRRGDRLAILIAVGSAVCGNTAIVATAPVIGARAREVAYAVATITLFGTLAVFLYPTIGRAIGLPQTSFGLWAGVAVHDTSQVIATSAAYGPDALDVATVVKLIRNALMAPLLFLIATGWAARAAERIRPARWGGAGSVGPSPCSCSGSLPLPRCGRSASSTPRGGHAGHGRAYPDPRRPRRRRDVDPRRGAARDELAAAGRRVRGRTGGRTRDPGPIVTLGLGGGIGP